MTPSAHTEPYKNHRFPGEMISHGVWLYYRPRRHVLRAGAHRRIMVERFEVWRELTGWVAAR